MSIPPKRNVPDASEHLSIDDIKGPQPEQIPNVPDSETSLEFSRLEFARIEAELQSYKQDVSQRRQYAPKLFKLTCYWLGAVLGVVVLNGLSTGGTDLYLLDIRIRLQLSDGVILALLGTTTVNVIGLFLLVTKYLFPHVVPPSYKNRPK